MKTKGKGIPVNRLCCELKMSRQNYYKARKTRQRRQVDEQFVLEQVRKIRKDHPRMGCRKLYWKLKQLFEEEKIIVGRDRLFEILRKNEMLVERLPRSVCTTTSYHNLPIFTNLIKGKDNCSVNEVWLSDITYIRTDAGFLYLSLIQDKRSRKIVGYHCGDSLETEGCLKALEMALKGMPKGVYPIHHSDRGSQYCSHLYVDMLRDFHLKISMTEKEHCAENAQAERLNGILKQEYGLRYTFRTKKQAREAVIQAVNMYNNYRPHISLNYEVPTKFYEKVA